MDYEMMEKLHDLLDKFAGEHMKTMLGIDRYWDFIETRDLLYHIMWETLDDEV